ncbi:MAG: HAMP domain-containing sensor histidine kinase [Candidatus Saccharimonadales bacterium]
MKKSDQALRFLRSTTARLALSYLVIIMLMSIGFSVVLYKASAHELGRQIPPRSFFSNTSSGIDFADPRQFFRQRVEEGRATLRDRLFLLNVVTLFSGGFLSYYLARRTLDPIEEAMEAQNRFISDASHELKTPLTALQSSNEVALRKSSLTLAGAKDVIRSTIEETAKLKELSDGLLSLAVQDGARLDMRPVSLQAIAAEAMEQVIHPAQAKRIAVRDSVPKAMIMGDARSLTQVVVILLDNAIKYSTADSTIYLDGSLEEGYGYLTVRDEGQGISASDLPHVFDRFYRADRSRSKDHIDGYGLGLAIARKIIEQQHGDITASSTPRRGSTFTIKLRLA